MRFDRWLPLGKKRFILTYWIQSAHLVDDGLMVEYRGSTGGVQSEKLTGAEADDLWRWLKEVSDYTTLADAREAQAADLLQDEIMRSRKAMEELESGIGRDNS